MYYRRGGAPTVATERVKGTVGLMGVVDRPKDRAVALLSLKRSSAESAFASNKRALSNGMSIRFDCKLPEKPVVLSQTWRRNANQRGHGSAQAVAGDKFTLNGEFCNFSAVHDSLFNGGFDFLWDMRDDPCH